AGARPVVGEGRGRTRSGRGVAMIEGLRAGRAAAGALGGGEGGPEGTKGVGVPGFGMLMAMLLLPEPDAEAGGRPGGVADAAGSAAAGGGAGGAPAGGAAGAPGGVGRAAERLHPELRGGTERVPRRWERDRAHEVTLAEAWPSRER